jgi:SagB-type dehydrogenase family enzyme
MTQELIHTRGAEDLIRLPKPQYVGELSVEGALLRRRSVREFREEPLTIAEVSQLLWCAQGVTGSAGERTAASAGALYPLESYLVAGNIQGISKGIWKYHPHKHEASRLVAGDKRAQLSRAALHQTFIETAPMVLVFAAVYERTTSKYGDRGIRYVHMEVGHVAQNVYLQAAALDLGTVAVGAFDDKRAKELLHIAGEEQPLYIMPVGKS